MLELGAERALVVQAPVRALSSHLPSAVGPHEQGTVGPQHPAQLGNARRDVRFLHVLQDVIHRDEVERARVGGQVVDRGDGDLRGLGRLLVRARPLPG